MQNDEGNFERTRLNIGAYGVTVTSWYDTDRQVWRASAPSMRHALGDSDADAVVGQTRQQAIEGVHKRLAYQLGRFAGERSTRI